MAFTVEFRDPENSQNSLVIDDDERVAYAYFRVGEKITGHVWLYNSHRDISEQDYDISMERIPPLMENSNVSNPGFQSIQDISDIEVSWTTYKGVREVAIYIRNTIHAQVGDGDLPGGCRLAIADCPIANAIPNARAYVEKRGER